MPDFMVTSPDGKQYKITAPEGTTKEQALDHFRNQSQSPAGGAKSPQPAGGDASAKGGGGSWSSAADFFASIPKGLAEATRPAGAFGTQGALEVPDEGLEKARAGAAEQLHQPQGFAGRVGAATGAALTNPLTFVPQGGLLRTGLAAMGSIIGGQAGADVGGMAGHPVLGGFIGGALGGGAGARLGGGAPPATAARVSTPKAADNPTVDAASKTLRSFGVEPPASAVTGGRTTADFERLGGGGPVLQAEKQLTSAGSNLMGTMGDNISNELLERNMTRMKGDFERSLAPLSIRTDEELLNGVTALREDMLRRAGENTWRKIDALLEDAGLSEKQLEDGTAPPRWKDNGRGSLVMEGPDYHRLVKTNSDLDKAIHSGDPDVAPYAHKLRDLLDSALERSSTSPAQQQALALFKKTKEDYFNQKVITEAIVRDAKEGPRRGLIDPNKLYSRLMTYGWDGGRPTTKLQELASAGKTAVPPYKPAGGLGAEHAAGSGRNIARVAGGAAGGLLGSVAGPKGTIGGAALGAAAGPYAVGRFVNTPAMQNYLKRQRSITQAMRAAAKPEEAGPKIARTALRGTIGAAVAARKKERERPRVYEE